MLRPVLGDRYPFLPFFVAILVSACLGGYGAAAMALFASWFCLEWFDLIPAPYELADSSQTGVAFAFFLAGGSAVAVLGGSLRIAQRRARASDTELQRVLEDRKAAQEWLRTTLASISDAVITTDPRGRVISLNPVAERLTGWLAAEAVGRELDQVLRLARETSAGLVPCPIGPVLQGRGDGEVGEPLALQGRDGSARLIEHRLAPIRGDLGMVQGVVVCFRDVTAEHHAQQVLRDVDRRKDEFLVMLGHELRNPLAPIQSSLELMSHAMRTGADWTQDYAIAIEQVRHLTRLVDDLLDVSRISHGKIELRKELIEVDPLIDRVVRSKLAELGMRDLALSVSRSPEPLLVRADPTRLEQILGNLLGNAIRFTESGGRLWLSSRRQADDLVLQVRDTGIGIRPELLDRIFELFVQGDRRPGHVREGLGIGLSLVRALARGHGGTVTAVSEGPGRGSTFTVRLPGCLLRTNGTHAALPAPAATPAASTEETPGQPGPPPLRVLIVDDNRVAADTLARLLRESGRHTVHVSYDGMTALDAVDAFRPEVVLLDLDLPGIDGYEVARILRSEPATRDLSIIAVSGWGMEENRRLSREAGIDQHLLKPVQLATLEEILATHTHAQG